MATPTRRLSVFSDGSYSVVDIPRPPSSSSLYRVQIDAELGRTDRARSGNPMMFFLREGSCLITREWQWYLMAINPGMTTHNIAMLLDNTKAFCNGTGFYGTTDRQNWIENENITAQALPAWSKVYVCGGAVVEIIGGVVTTMDGSAPPLLADGYSYPMSQVQARNIRCYRYSPQSHPHLFFAAVNTHDDGTPVPFPHGATYPWYRGGQMPVSFIPLVADLRDGPVIYPPGEWKDNSARLVRV